MDVRGCLINAIVRTGQSRRFAELISDSLATEKRMEKMLGYVLKNQPNSAEEIADEMLAINDDFDAWQKRKESEYFQGKYTEYLNSPYREEE